MTHGYSVSIFMCTLTRDNALECTYSTVTLSSYDKSLFSKHCHKPDSVCLYVRLVKGTFLVT